MAYTLDGTADPAKRPLMFSFNGGRVRRLFGSISVRSVPAGKNLDDGLMPPPPTKWRITTRLAHRYDIVFIDPVERAIRGRRNRSSRKNSGALTAISNRSASYTFYLGRAERWASPLFLVGESYGTTRAAGLSNYLFEHGVGLNGILLISTVMNFGSIRFAEGNDLPIVLILPSYTSTAWYHKKLPPEQQRRPLRDVLRDAENFAANEYLPALLRIDRLTAQEKQNLLDKFSMYTGLSKQFIDQSNFRVDLNEFLKELLRDQRRRWAGSTAVLSGSTAMPRGGGTTEFDPSMSAIRPPIHRPLTITSAASRNTSPISNITSSAAASPARGLERR